MRTIGQAVRTRAVMPAGHVRLPRYLRGRAGRIVAVHGALPLADERALGRDLPQPLYTVAFDAREIWGATAERGEFTIHADLWESYFDE